MTKKLASLVIALLFATTVYAQSNVGWGNIVTPFNGTTLTGSAITSSVYTVPANAESAITWQVVYASAPGSITVLLQGSIDNSTWDTIQSTTSTTDVVNTSTTSAYRFVRFQVSASSGGSTFSVKFITKQAGGSAGAGAGSTVDIASIDGNAISGANLPVDCVTGCAGSGTEAADDGSIPAGSTNANSNAFANVYNGAAWTRLTLGQAANSASIPVALASNSSLAVTGTFWQATQPVSGTVAATQSGTWTVQPGNTANTTPWLFTGSGTAGSAATGVATVQGIASMTPLLANPGTAANWGVGATGSAVPANGIYHGINVAGNLRGSTGLALGSTFSQTMAIVDASGNQITSFGGSGGTASNYGSAFPSSGTAVGFTDGTNMVGGTILTTQADNLANTVDGIQVSNLNYVFDGTTWDRLPGTSALGVLSDTELPAAAAAADNMANPTAPFILSANMCWDGATWDRCTAQALPAGSAIIGKVGIDQTTPGTTNAVQLTGTGTAQIGHLEANQSVNVAQINGVTTLMGNGASGTGAQRVTIANDSTGVVGLNAGSALIGQVAGVATATTTNAGVPISVISAASTNSTSVKGSAGNVYGIYLVNTTATLYYIRFYNASSAPTCSSATNYVFTLPVPASATGAGFSINIENGTAFTTGIAYCITGGPTSTDNTNAAVGIYGFINYK